jgi:hypothetical protein
VLLLPPDECTPRGEHLALWLGGRFGYIVGVLAASRRAWTKDQGNYDNYSERWEYAREHG